MRACLASGGYSGCDLLDQVGSLHLAADADTLRRAGLGTSLTGGGGGAAAAPTDDSADHAARAAGNAARNAADHAAALPGRRQIVFLNHRDVFGNLFGAIRRPASNWRGATLIIFEPPAEAAAEEEAEAAAPSESSSTSPSAAHRCRSAESGSRRQMTTT